MKILLIGGTSALALALRPILTQFAEVVTAGRVDCDLMVDLSAVHPDFSIPSDVDVVINTAAAFGGSRIEDFEQSIAVNILGTTQLCRLAAEASVEQLVQVSSIFALLDSGSSFFSPYALSKRQSDEWAELHAGRGLPLTIVRPSQFYGVGAFNRRHQPFLSTIIERVQRNEDVLIYGSNDALRNFIHIEDVAAIIAHIVQQRVLGTYSCTHPDNVRYSEVAQAAIDAFGSASTIRFLSDKPDIADNVFAPDDTLYRKIGYSPTISMAMGMQMEAHYLRAQDQ